MHDFKFKDAGIDLSPFYAHDYPDRPQSAACAYLTHQNFKRVRTLHDYLPRLIAGTRRYQGSLTHACVEILNNPKPSKEEASAKSEEIEGRLTELIEADFNDPDFSVEGDILGGWHVFDLACANASDKFDSFAFMSAVLNSMVLGAWGAVEVCLDALWRDAVNEYPEYLAALVGGPNRMASFIEARNQGANWSPPADRDALTPFLPNSSDPATDLLDDFKKNGLGFSSLKAARNTYSRAFAKNFSDIDAALCDPCIDALALVRNLIAHKDGVIDSRFMEQSRFINALGPIRALGDQATFIVDGEFVRKLIEPVIPWAVTTINAVHKWMKNNKP